MHSRGRRLRVLAIISIAVSGCIEPQLLHCQDKLCSADSVCLANGECASREAVAACSALVDGEACQTSLFDGTCEIGACTAARCGDGFVAGAEQCDGSVGGIDCVQFGFDLGVPVCNARCDLDVVDSCERFGWRRKDPTTVMSAWVAGDRLAFTRQDDRKVELHVGNDVFVDDGDYYRVAGNATTVVAWGDTSKVVRSDGGAWIQLPPIDISYASPARGVVAADGTIYLAGGVQCQVQALAPGASAWVEILSGSPGECNDLEMMGTKLVVAHDSGEIQRYDGSSWELLLMAPHEPKALLARGSDLYVAMSAGGLSRWDGATLGPSLVSDFTVFDLVASGSYIYFEVASNGLYGRLDDHDDVEYLRGPIAGDLLTDAVSGQLHIADNGIYELLPMIYGEHQPIPGTTYDLTTLANGTIVGTQPSTIWIRTNDNLWEEDYPPAIEQPIIAGRSRTDFYVTDGSVLEHTDGSGTGFPTVTPTGFVGIHDLWATTTGEPSLFAVGDNSLIMAKSGATWTTELPPSGAGNCTLSGLIGNASNIYAAGACSTTGIVWMRAGTGVWTEIYRGGPPLAAIALASDGELIAAGPLGGARTQVGTWIADDAARGISVSATTSSDVFVGGGPGDLVHWDGTNWSRVAVSGATKPRVVATPHAIYITSTERSVLLR